MSRRSYQHTHTYKRRSEVSSTFRCVEDGCPHILNDDLLIGRQARCPECTNKFTVREINIQSYCKELFLTCGCAMRQMKLELGEPIPEGEKFSDDPFAALLRKKEIQ